MWVATIPPLLIINGVCFCVTWLIGRAIFAPLYQRTLLFQPSGRFRISDVMVLAFYVQIITAVGVSCSSPHARDNGDVFFLCGELIAIAAFWWLNGLRMLGRGGVDGTWHRWWFLGLVLPAGYVGGLMSIGSVFLIPMFLAALTSIPEPEAIIMLLVFPGSWAAVYYANRSSRFIASQARHDRAEKDGVHFLTQTVAHRRPLPDPANDENAVRFL